MLISQSLRIISSETTGSSIYLFYNTKRRKKEKCSQHAWAAKSEEGGKAFLAKIPERQKTLLCIGKEEEIRFPKGKEVNGVSMKPRERGEILRKGILNPFGPL